MKYSIAYNFDKRIISFYKKINKKKNNVFELFFSFDKGFLGSARYYDLPSISLKEIETHFEYIKKNNFKINYLLNSSFCPDLKDRHVKSNINSYLLWLESQKADIITVGNKNLLKYISKHFPSFDINISIVMGIKTIKQVNELRSKFPNIKRITLHQSVNRDKDLLIEHIKNSKNYKKFKPIEIEILANEICLYKCSKMKQHYLCNSIKSFHGSVKHENVFESFCKSKRSTDPIHFLNSTFIRPEDVRLYEKIGVDILKLSGREKESNYLKLVSKVYVKQKHSGNIMALFDERYWLNNNPPYIDNRNLDGFLKYLWSRKNKRLESIPKEFKQLWSYKK